MRRRPTRLIAVIAMLVAVPARSAGNGNSQGTLFSGTGVDWQRTATPAQPPGWELSPVFPPQPYQTFSINAAWVTPILPCTSLSSVHASCWVFAQLQTGYPASRFCGKWLEPGSGQLLSMFVLNALWDGGGDFNFHSFWWPALPFVTFACGAANPSSVEPSEWEALGAVGKCLLWPRPVGLPMGFPPTGTDPSEFRTCIRMVRADYCGDGVSHTKDSTLIEPYRRAEAVSHELPPAFIFEANWDERGAILRAPCSLCLAPRDVPKEIPGQDRTIPSRKGDSFPGTARDGVLLPRYATSAGLHEGRVQREHRGPCTSSFRNPWRRFAPSALRPLQLAASGERAGQGRLVRELEVSAHRQALGEPGDADAHRLEQPHQIERGRLALDVRVGGDDDLLDLARPRGGRGAPGSGAARGRCRRAARARRGARGSGP